MKNKKLIFIGLGVIAAIIMVLIVLFTPSSPVSEVLDIKTETVVTDKDDLYIIGANYIKEKFSDLNTRKESEDYTVFLDYHKYYITKDSDYYYAYMWVLSESYYVKNETLYQGRMNSSLYKVVFKDDEVYSYEMPNDGKTYEKTESYTMTTDYDFPASLKSMCPNRRVYNSIMNTEISLSTKEEVEEHYSYLKDLTIHSQVIDNGDSKNDTVPYPNDKAHGGSGYVPR